MAETSEVVEEGGTSDDVSLSFHAQYNVRQADAAIADLRRTFMRSNPETKLESDPESKMKAAPPPAPDSPEVRRSMVRDVARGSTELARGAVKGTRDFAQNAINTAAALTTWVDENLAPGVPFPVEYPGPDGEQWAMPPSTPGEAAANAAMKPPAGKPPQLPDLAAPQSVTGKVAKNVTQFLLAYGTAGAAFARPLGALRSVGTAGEVAASTLQGAAGDFAFQDPHEERLSNLVQSVPAIKNPVTEYLAAKKDDGQLEGRLKNALEGAGVGLAVEGLMRFLKFVRETRAARAAAGEGQAAADAAGAAAKDEAIAKGLDETLSSLGDPSSRELFVTATKAKLDDAASAAGKIGPEDVGRAAAGGELEGDVFINFARIDTPEDVKKVMQAMADADAKGIGKAARGKRTWKQTRLDAEQQNAWKVMTERLPGGTLNAEQMTALRDLWVTASEKLTEVATKAVTNDAPANLVAFRKMLTVHQMIQREAIGARTEIARALNAMKIPAKGGAARAKQLQLLLEESGGADVTLTLANKVADLAGHGASAELNELVRGGLLARTKAAVLQAWYFALLSSAPTHAANFLSGFVTIGQQVAERAVAARIGRMLGTDAGVEMGEASAKAYGAIQGWRTAMRVLRKRNTLKRAALGEVELLTPQARDALKLGHKSQDVLGGAFSPETWNVARNTLGGQALNALDAVTMVPGRLMASGDELWKMVSFTSELHALAYREAMVQLRSGKITQDAFEKTVAKLVRRPSEEMKQLAAEASLYATFTQKPAAVLDKLGTAIQDTLGGRVLLPFKNTPINILTNVAERSPFAPLVGQWRADVMAGGARADLALARVASGTMIMATAMDMALTGVITGKGPKEPAARAALERQGWKPYSIKVRGVYVSYNRLDPIGMMAGLAADTADVMANAADDETKAIEELVIGTSLAVAKNVTSKTYMSGVAAFFDAVSDPDRHGTKWAAGLAGTLVPSGVNAVSKAIDPEIRAAQGMLEAIQKRGQWWGERLPTQRDLWGRPQTYRTPMGAAWDFTMPIGVSLENSEPIDKELVRLEHYPPLPAKKVLFNGVQIDLKNFPKAYWRYVELAGNELKDPAYRMGLKDYLNALVTGKHPNSQMYNLQMSHETPEDLDERRRKMVDEAVSDYRKQARARLFQEFPELQAYYDTKRNPRTGKGALGSDLLLNMTSGSIVGSKVSK